MSARVLIIAGSDSGGGAGIQGDIKTVTALGGFAMSAVTALTAQNTLGVHGVHPVPIDFVVQQIRVVVEDLGVDAVKTGMLATAEVIEAVAAELRPLKGKVPIVVDPVMVAKGGHVLLEPEAKAALMRELIPLADVLTPNTPEAEALLGIDLKDNDALHSAGEELLKLGAGAVLMKGGRMEHAELVDVLVEKSGETVYFGDRIPTRNTHGTGCTLSSAIATGLALGLPLEPAVHRARAYVIEAIRSAPSLGSGHGPLNHGHTVALFMLDGVGRKRG